MSVNGDGTAGNPWVISLTAKDADVLPLTSPQSQATLDMEPLDTWKLAINANRGTFQIDASGRPTRDIEVVKARRDPSVIKDALNDVLGQAHAVVTGAGTDINPWTISVMQGDRINEVDRTNLVSDGYLTLTNTKQGDAPTLGQWVLSNTANGGQFKLRFQVGGDGHHDTVALPFDADPYLVEKALQNLPNVDPESVQVIGNAQNWNITLADKDYVLQNLSLTVQSAGSVLQPLSASGIGSAVGVANKLNNNNDNVTISEIIGSLNDDDRLFGAGANALQIETQGANAGTQASGSTDGDTITSTAASVLSGSLGHDHY